MNLWHTTRAVLPRHQVCDMMCASVREQMMLGVNDYLVIDRTQWMQNWPGQIVLNGSQVPITARQVVLAKPYFCRHPFISISCVGRMAL